MAASSKISVDKRKSGMGGSWWWSSCCVLRRVLISLEHAWRACAAALTLSPAASASCARLLHARLTQRGRVHFIGNVAYRHDNVVGPHRCVNWCSSSDGSSSNHGEMVRGAARKICAGASRGVPFHDWIEPLAGGDLPTTPRVCAPLPGARIWAATWRK